MRKILALLSSVSIIIVLLSGCTTIGRTNGVVLIDWVDFVKWDGISYERDYNNIEVPTELIVEKIGFVVKQAPSEVSSPDYKPEDGMASFLPVGTEIFEIHGYDSKKYIAVYTDGKFILYKDHESESISFDDMDNAYDLKPTKYETVNNLEGITMSVKEGTASSTGLSLIFENNSESQCQCIYGEYFVLEKKLDEKWYEVPVTFEGDYGFEDIGYELNPGDSGEWTVDWKWLYGSLDAGEYRIVKDILDFRKTGDYDTYYLAAEFAID